MSSTESVTNNIYLQRELIKVVLYILIEKVFYMYQCYGLVKNLI